MLITPFHEDDFDYLNNNSSTLSFVNQLICSAEEEGAKKRDDDEVDTDEELEMLNRNDNLFVSDFDLMMEKKKAERKRTMSRRKKDVILAYPICF